MTNAERLKRAGWIYCGTKAHRNGFIKVQRWLDSKVGLPTSGRVYSQALALHIEKDRASNKVREEVKSEGQ